MLNYWLAGAHFNGRDHDDSEVFFRRSIWEMHFDVRDSKSDRDHYFSLYTNIHANDRIALKIAHHHSDQLDIRALGIVRENPHNTINDDRLVLYVEWVLHAMNRHVSAHKCYQRIHGPLGEGEWRNAIFSL